MGIRHTRLKAGFTACAGIACLGVLAGCGGSEQSVTVAVAEAHVVDASIGGLGGVSAAVEEPIQFRIPEFSGDVTITSVSAVLGEHVTAGEPLVTIDPAPLEQMVQSLSTQLQAAEAEQVSAQTQLQLAQAGISVVAAQNALTVAEEELNQAEQEEQANTDPSQDQRYYDAVQNDYNTVTKDQISLVDAEDSQRSDSTQLSAELESDNARVALDQQLLNIASGKVAPVITAPISGNVESVSVEAGATISVGQTLMEIVDPTTIRVSAQMPITALGQVSAGSQATLTFPALPSVQLQGTVIGVSPSANEDGQGIQVLVQANNTPDQKVIPGLQALVSVGSPHQAKVTIPEIAIQNIDQDPTVYVVAGGIAHRQLVQVGAVDGTRAEILGGLRDGQEVVLIGTQQLQDGLPVHVSATTT